jgi:uncharacterized membrane protein
MEHYFNIVALRVETAEEADTATEADLDRMATRFHELNTTFMDKRDELGDGYEEVVMPHVRKIEALEKEMEAAAARYEDEHKREQYAELLRESRQYNMEFEAHRQSL